MMPARRKRSTLELGQDAFLDIVANLVGILIILVVVLGTHSQQAIKAVNEEITQNDEASTEQLAVLQEQAARALSAQRDSDRLEQTIRQFDAEIAMRDQQRAVLMDLLAEAELAWEEKKKELNDEATAIAARQSEYERLEVQLAEVRGERERLESEPGPVVAVQHLPTPMAKTVFGDELHFRLKGNRISVVPIDKLVEEIRHDLQRFISSSRDSKTDSIGPLRGYVAHYELSKTRVGSSVRVELVQMEVEPLEEAFGQPIQSVLGGSSEIDIELAGRDPANTTITVWVYPDSFAAFRQLKEHLYRRGFATAARPMPMDELIRGGPQGSRSDAQ